MYSTDNFVNCNASVAVLQALYSVPFFHQHNHPIDTVRATAGFVASHHAALWKCRRRESPHPGVPIITSASASVYCASVNV